MTRTGTSQHSADAAIRPLETLASVHSSIAQPVLFPSCAPKTRHGTAPTSASTGCWPMMVTACNAMCVVTCMYGVLGQ